MYNESNHSCNQTPDFKKMRTSTHKMKRKYKESVLNHNEWQNAILIL